MQPDTQLAHDAIRCGPIGTETDLVGMGVQRMRPLLIGACILMAVITARVTLATQDPQDPQSRPKTMLEDGETFVVEDVETFVFERVNEVRTGLGLRALATDPILTMIARNHSKDMLERDYLGHINPEGKGPVQRVGEDHRRLVGEVSENVWSALLLKGTSPSRVADRIVDAVMASEGHRRNMLARELTHLGLGVYAVPSRDVGIIEYRATQLFADVEGYTEQLVPERLSQGRFVNFSLKRPDGGRSDAEFFDLWSPEEQRVVFGPVGLVPARIAAVPGTYQLRFYHPLGLGKYRVSSGPTIVLE